ncbi:MAG: hypothetical protein JOS17DRAFT_738618 [Linnemannia elongata]|nr:MAG: hypothetical protein JOS17DRAFT_738618 [Linnemannia elongata]
MMTSRRCHSSYYPIALCCLCFMLIIILLPPGFACLSPVQVSLFMRVLLSNTVQSNRVLTMPFCFFLLFYF